MILDWIELLFVPLRCIRNEMRFFLWLKVFQDCIRDSRISYGKMEWWFYANFLREIVKKIHQKLWSSDSLQFNAFKWSKFQTFCIIQSWKQNRKAKVSFHVFHSVASTKFVTARGALHCQHIFQTFWDFPSSNASKFFNF